MVFISAGWALNLKELKLLSISDDILSTTEHLSHAHLSANRDIYKDARFANCLQRFSILILWIFTKILSCQDEWSKK